MAVTCPKCSEQISSEATHCPHCGVPNVTGSASAERPKRRTRRIVVVLLLIGACTALVIGLRLSPDIRPTAKSMTGIKVGFPCSQSVIDYFDTVNGNLARNGLPGRIEHMSCDSDGRVQKASIRVHGQSVPWEAQQGLPELLRRLTGR